MYHPVISYQDHVYYRYCQNTVRGCNFTRNFREKSSLRRNSSQNIRAVFSSYFIMSLIGFALKPNVSVMIVWSFFYARVMSYFYRFLRVRNFNFDCINKARCTFRLSGKKVYLKSYSIRLCERGKLRHSNYCFSST